MIVCTLCNLQRAKGDPALQPADIMPWLKSQAEAEVEKQPVTRELLEQVNAALGGTAKIVS